VAAGYRADGHCASAAPRITGQKPENLPRGALAGRTSPHGGKHHSAEDDQHYGHQHDECARLLTTHPRCAQSTPADGADGVPKTWRRTLVLRWSGLVVGRTVFGHGELPAHAEARSPRAGTN
jgi:hypothetical protein